MIEILYTKLYAYEKKNTLKIRGKITFFSLILRVSYKSSVQSIKYTYQRQYDQKHRYGAEYSVHGLHSL